MAFSIPDKGEGQNDIQSILFQEYLDVLVAGINGTDCVLSGGAVTPNALLVLNGAKAATLSNGTLFATAASTTITIGAADATNPRIDLVVITSAGAWAVRAGTAAAAPKPPARTANDVVMAAVYVPALDATIDAAQIVDMRVFRTQGPIVIYKITSPVTINTDNTIQTYLSLSIPSGLFLTGRMLRVHLSGNFLANNSTPAWTPTISFGGTAMFADASATYGADADRGGWTMNLMLTAQSNTDQALTGTIGLHSSTRTAPTSGIAGSFEVATHNAMPVDGAAAVDADAANRILLIQWTMSVSHASVETVLESAVVELL